MKEITTRTGIDPPPPSAEGPDLTKSPVLHTETDMETTAAEKRQRPLDEPNDAEEAGDDKETQKAKTQES